jgi:hypothetical protein
MLSHFRTKTPSHAALRDFFTQSEVEVTGMDEELTILERDIAIIEETLRTMIEIDPTVVQELVESSHASAEPAGTML